MGDMTSHRSSGRIWHGLAAVAFLGLVTACGGSDDAGPVDDASSAPASEPSDQALADDAAESSDDAALSDSEPTVAPPAGSPGQGSATLTLDNGESFEFSVLCSLEPQIAAGSEILFTATAMRPPYFDITQFGDEGPVTGIASVTMTDEDFNTVWEASTFYEAAGGSLDLSLDGSTISGSGTFFPGGDIAVPPVDGTVVANC